MIYQGDIENALKKNNIDNFMVLNDQLVVIYVEDDFDEAILSKIDEIAWWNESTPLSSLIEITNNLENGESAIIASGTDYIYKNPYTNISGKGVIVAIMDSGIDYLHPDFIDENNKSRIKSLWDQENNKFTPPDGFIFGSEFKNEDLNKAIKENDSTLSVDKVGTGTLAAGIVGGNGRVNPLYRGVATECELVVVKLRAYEGTYKKGKINYTMSDFLAAIKYVTDISQKEKKPIIINLTVGAMSSAISSANIFEVFNVLRSAGVIMVSGVGNEGNTDVHYHGKFTNLNEFQDIIIQVGEQENIDIVLNAIGPDKINAMLISPAGEVSYTIKYSPEYFVHKGKFNLENTFYSMRYIYPWIASGSEKIEIKLKDIKPGIWTLRLMPEYIVSGEYDVYLPNKNLISKETRFLDPDSVSTTTMLGGGNNIITVGVYNDKTNSMWLGSSKGSIIGGGIKPDIVAPGVDIISTYIGGIYNTGTGSGVSSSIVSGISALLVEYLLLESSLPKTSLFTEVLKTYLMLGATKKPIYTYPNISQGYGILNLQNTIEEIANNL
ncbi:bile acid germinant receptor pseudoprotease CspC [Romboutsia sp.]|uniref:bile acid germinant receptor pseudoprotease CspC n=1 Tax=Romboutsia sp. TaxID=1965302 RepID=UPI003F3A9690